MFSKFALVAFTATASVNALSLMTPTDVRSATPLELAWNFDNTDPLFSIELAHPSFRADFALANNVNPSTGGARLIIPALTIFDDQYAIRAVNVSNINQEYSRTSNFAIGNTLTSTGPPISSGSTSATNPPSGVTTTGIPSNTGSAPNTNSNNNSNTNSNTNANTNTSTNTNTNTTTTTNTNTNTRPTGGSPTNTPQNGGNGAISAGVSFAAVVVGAVAAVGLF